MTKNSGWNLGKKGWVIIILAFLTIYINSAMTSDSLNVTISAFAERGLNASFLYSLSTVATVCAVIGSIIFGKVMQMKTVRMVWGCSMIVTVPFAVLWGTAHTLAIYTICYLICYVTTTLSAMLFGYQVIANWYPKKRGLAMGLITAGYPLSAATTSAIGSSFIINSGLHAFYIFMAAIAGIIGLIVLIYVRDFPEEKGCYPDNNAAFDFETAKKEHEANLQYMATSKWTIRKVLTTGRMWQLWFSIGILGFLAMGIMSNFVNKFIEYQYQMPEILMMLAIAGIIAVPGSVFIGWLDLKLGTKRACIITYVLGILAIALNLTHVHILHYISLPILALMLGGASNFLVSCTSAIWGRYDFQNAFRVIQPLNSIMTGVGITVVGVIGTKINYTASYIALLILSIAGFVVFLTLKVAPIDDEVR